MTAWSDTDYPPADPYAGRRPGLCPGSLSLAALLLVALAGVTLWALALGITATLGRIAEDVEGLG